MTETALFHNPESSTASPLVKRVINAMLTYTVRNGPGNNFAIHKNDGPQSPPLVFFGDIFQAIDKCHEMNAEEAIKAVVGETCQSRR